MGIKFLCPNGHKLNVKSFLAGKKGVCPKCGISLRIPAATDTNLSDDPADEAESPAEAGVAAGMTAAATVSPIAATAAPTVPYSSPAAVRPVATAASHPAAAPVAAMPVAGMPVAGMPVAGIPVPAMPMGHATGPAVMPPMPGQAAGDPIAEAPAATWYVRPPGGGQYGPARGEVMRKWIAEGRVSSDSLVWR
jgi:hypothetical protein